MHLRGKNVIVTGGSSGLGFEICKELVSEKARVIFCSRDIDKVKEATVELKKSNPTAFIQGFACDVSDIKAVNEFRQLVGNYFENVDGMILNAGDVGTIQLFSEANLEEWLHDFNINFLASINMLFVFGSLFNYERGASVVQISGGGATKPLPGMTSYACSKVSLVRLMETLAQEYKNRNIRFNSVAPGLLKTKLFEKQMKADPNVIGSDLFKKLNDKKNISEDSRNEAAKLVAFLLSNHSNNINGKLISAEWDNWRNLKNYINEKNSDDLFTIRRVDK